MRGNTQAGTQQCQQHGSKAPPREALQVLAAIRSQFGFVPAFFMPAVEQPDVLAALWQQALSAYVNSPLPGLFKERLSAYLARYGSVPYSLVCHSCSLHALGQTGSEVLELLSEPMPANDDIERIAARMAHGPPELPETGSTEELEVLRLCGAIYLQQTAAPRARTALRQRFGEAHYNRLILLVHFVRTCHGWLEAHPEVSYERDARYQAWFKPLVSEDEGLQRFFMDLLRAFGRDALDRPPRPPATHATETVRARARKTGKLTARAQERYRAALEQLAQSEARLLAVFELLPIGIWVANTEGRIIHCNPAAECIWGGHRLVVEAKSTPFEGWWLDSGKPVTPSDWPLSRALKHGEATTGRLIRLRGFDGVERVLRISAQPLKTRKGTVFGAIATHEDVTERMRATDEHRARAEFNQQLVGIVSHDLRNPISAMLMSAASLNSRKDLDAQARRAVRRILSSGERATRMVRDLLDFTQTRLGGGLPLQKHRVDLAEVIEQVVEETRLSHPGRELLFEGPRHLWGNWDTDRLAQVASNLLSNAIAYSPSDSPVRATLTRGATEVRLSVHNSGEPIPPELLPTLFRPMQRGRSHKDSHSRSIGLGLYIVEQVVRGHGGRVEVHSSREEGTTFSACLQP